MELQSSFSEGRGGRGEGEDLKVLWAEGLTVGRDVGDGRWKSQTCLVSQMASWWLPGGLE